MKVACFSTKAYERHYLQEANTEFGHSLVFHEAHLNPQTTALLQGEPSVCLFVNDQADEAVLEKLKVQGVGHVALRCAGFNNVDLDAARSAGIRVTRVPAYSPHAVAEHTLALALSLNRKTHRAYNRVKEHNFSIEGLMGFDMYGKTVGLVGTGKIGLETARIFKGMGCEVLGYDPQPSQEGRDIGVSYTNLATLLKEADIISLHCPLNPDSHHLINADTIDQMKPGVMLLNTSRGAIVDTKAVIQGLKTGKIGYLGIDVYEEEGDLFFEDLSNQVIQDDVFARLQTFPNVLITSHQAFFTHEAMQNIAQTTLENIHQFEQGGPLANALV